MKVKIIGTLSISFAATFLALIVGDLILGHFFSTSIDRKDYYSADSYFGWTYAKGGHFDSYNAFGERVALEFNAEGFRLWNSPTASAVGKRILYIGDSVTGGIQVNRGDHFIEKIDRDNQAQGVASVGFNFGVNGFSSDQEFLVLERYISTVKPDLVVYLMVDNDLEYLDTDRFIVNRVAYGKPTVHFNGNAWTIIPPPFDKSELPVSFFERIAGQSFIVSRLRRLLQERRGSDDIASQDGDFQALNPHVGWDNLVAARKEDSLGSIRWQQFAALVAAMRDLSQRHGASFLLVPFPDPWSMVNEARSAIQKNGADPELILRRVIQLAAEIGISTPIHLMDYVANGNLSKEDREKLFFIRGGRLYDGHLTVFGHKKFAEVLAPEIRRALNHS